MARMAGFTSWARERFGKGIHPALGGTGYVDVYCAGIAGAFNPAAGGLAVWVKVQDAGVWTNGVLSTLAIIQTDASNRLRILKSNTNNSIQWQLQAGGINKTGTVLANSEGWLQVGMTWATSDGVMQAYLNGEPFYWQFPLIGTWVGVPAAGGRSPPRVRLG